MKLTVPQLRVLRLLMPPDPSQPKYDWPCATRAGIQKTVGATERSGLTTTVLRGRGAAAGHKGTGGSSVRLLTTGLVETVVVEIEEGIKETSYRITEVGIEEYRKFVESGGELPPLRSREDCVNRRYIEKGT